MRTLAAACIIAGFAAILICVAHALMVPRNFPPLLPPAGKTLAAKPPFRFAILGDNRRNMTIFEDALARIMADDVSLILHTGDLVHRGEKERYLWLLHELHEMCLPVPFCAVPGNHDRDQEPGGPRRGLTLYENSFGPRRYWLACGNALFVAFDNATGTAGPDDLQWLDTTLAEHRDRYALCFVWMHYPPRDPRPGRSYSMYKGVDELVQVLTKHRVSAVFAGHIHGYLEGELDGIPLFVTGGAGARLQIPESHHHYLICTVHADGSLAIEKKDLKTTMNDDYIGYVWWVKFQSRPLCVGGAGFVLAGVVLGLAVRS